MNLNVDLIADALRCKFNVVREDAHEEELTFEQARLFNGDVKFLSGIVYVAQGEKLPIKPFFEGYCAIVSVGPSDKRYMASQCGYIEIEKDVCLFDVLNCIQEAYQKYNKWFLQMYEALSSEVGVQRLLDLTLPLLGNPVYVHDKHYRFIAYAEIPGMKGGSDIYGIRANGGRFALDAINVLKNTPYFEKTFQTTKPTFHIDNGECCYIYNNIRVRGEYWGRVFVDERVKLFQKSDCAIVGVLACMIEKALTCRNLSCGKHYRFLDEKLAALLDGQYIELSELEADMKLNHWDPGSKFFCFYVRLTQIDRALHTTINLCDLIESKLQSCVAFPYKDVIVGIVRVDSRSKTIERIDLALRDFQLHIGVSLMFDDFKEFPLYYKQASIALNCGIKENGGSWIHYFEEHCFSYMLDQCMDGLLPDMLFPPDLHKLIEHDRKKSTNYAETLRVYLENDMKPAKAMKALYIQRSTFLYRLERINEMMSADLEDEKTKIHFLLAFQLMDRCRGRMDDERPYTDKRNQRSDPKLYAGNL